jgi:hypothetical protein
MIQMWLIPTRFKTPNPLYGNTFGMETVQKIISQKFQTRRPRKLNPADRPVAMDSKKTGHPT